MNSIPWTKEETDFLLNKLTNTQHSRLTIYKLYVKTFGDIRSFNAIQRKITHLQEKGFVSYRKKVEENLRIGYADIEATDLEADFGYMLSYCIKVKDQKKIYGRVLTPNEIRSGIDDKGLLVELLTDLKNFDVLYFHYGSDGRFDVPFLRMRIFNNNLDKLITNLEEVYIRDTWKIARDKLKLSSNRLDNIADALNIEEVRKTPLLPSIWRLARRGDRRALSYIWKHNVNDVLVLELVHRKLSLIEKTKNLF